MGGSVDKEVIYVDVPVEVIVEVPVEIPVYIEPSGFTVVSHYFRGGELEVSGFFLENRFVESITFVVSSKDNGYFYTFEVDQEFEEGQFYTVSFTLKEEHAVGRIRVVVYNIE